MRASSALLGAILVLAAPGPASAAMGPYEPFPEDPTQRAEDTLRQLNDKLLPGTAHERLTPERLKKGVELRKGKPVRSSPSSKPGVPAAVNGGGVGLFERAGLDRPADQPSPNGLWLVALAATLALLAGVFEWRVIRLRESP